MAVLLLWMTFAVSAVWPPAAADGKEPVRLSAVAGIEGEIKQEQWVPIQVTIANDGPTIEGKVYISGKQTPADHLFAGTAEQAIELAQGAKKKLFFLVPEQTLVGTQTVVLEVDGNVVSKTRLQLRRLAPGTLAVGVLASSPDAANFLNGLAQDRISRQMRIYTLDSEAIPVVSEGLSGLDLLVMNDFPADTLSAEQVSAVENWVSRGGTLILGGGAEYQKTAAPFEQLSPVEVKGTKRLSSLAALENYEKKGEKLTFTSPVTISTGALKRGAGSYVEDHGEPIIASRRHGAGEVVYTAYNLAVAPFNTWAGNGALWGNIIGESGKNFVYDAPEPWSLLDAVRKIPSLKLPNLLLMGGLFVLYIILVGPVLYVILRKVNKQVWAWGIVPVVALVTAIGIYSFGMTGRDGGGHVHHVNVVKLGQGKSELRGATAIMLSKGGTYTVTWPVGFNSWPVDIATEIGKQGARVSRFSSERVRIVYDKVPPWSIREAYVEGQVDVGDIVGDLVFSDGRIKGKVTNQSTFDLTDVSLVAGGEVASIGQLKAGETKPIKVRHRVSQGDVMSRVPFPGGSAQWGGMTREEGLLQYLYMEAGDLNPLDSVVQLIGWTKQPVYVSQVVGKNVQHHSQTLVVAPLDVKPDTSGHFVFPEGALRPKVTEVTGGISVTENGIDFSQGKGTAVLVFRLPADQSVHLTRLKVHMQSPADKVEWFNWAKGTWEDVDLNQKTSGLDRYLSENNVLKLRIALDRDNSNGIYYEYPYLSVEGRVVR